MNNIFLVSIYVSIEDYKITLPTLGNEALAANDLCKTATWICFTKLSPDKKEEHQCLFVSSNVTIITEDTLREKLPVPTDQTEIEEAILADLLYEKIITQSDIPNLLAADEEFVEEPEYKYYGAPLLCDDKLFGIGHISLKGKDKSLKQIFHTFTPINAYTDWINKVFIEQNEEPLSLIPFEPITNSSSTKEPKPGDDTTVADDVTTVTTETTVGGENRQIVTKLTDGYVKVYATEMTSGGENSTDDIGQTTQNL